MLCIIKVEGRGPGTSRSEHNPNQLLPTVEDRAEEIFSSLDVDGDGEITQAEFIDGYLKMHSTVGGKHKWSRKKVNVIFNGVDSIDTNKIFRTYS